MLKQLIFYADSYIVLTPLNNLSEWNFASQTQFTEFAAP